MRVVSAGRRVRQTIWTTGGTRREGRVEVSEHGPGVVPHLRLDELLSQLQRRLVDVLETRDRINVLLEAVVSIGSDLELEAVLRRIVETAVQLVDARYGHWG